jgi:hypothetical protein
MAKYRNAERRGQRKLMKTITLTKSKVAIVDDEDFEWLSQWKWYCHEPGYAARNVRSPKRKIIWMHRLLCNTPEGMETDHINGNKLDNQKINLRSCTTSQNQQNRPCFNNNSSIYKGVSFYKRTSRWNAGIKFSGKKINLGYFDNPAEAALAYDEAAKKYFGEFAKTNFHN